MATKVLTPPTSKKPSISLAMIMTTARRRRYMTVSVISWAVMVLLALLVVVPAVQQILTQLSAITTAEEKIASEQAKITSLESLSTVELQQTNTVLEGALPREKPVLPLLYSLDRLAMTAQVSVSNFQISPGLLGTDSGKLDRTADATTISPNISALPLKMNVAGGFESLSAFFQSLDNVVPFIQVNSIKFQSDKTETAQATSSARYTADVDLSSLYLKKSPSGEFSGTVIPLKTEDQALLDKLGVAFAQRESDATAQAQQISTGSGRTNLFSVQ